jgi:hypothetical protein
LQFLGEHVPFVPRIARGMFAALADPAGVIAHRPGVLGRMQLQLEDWSTPRTGSPTPSSGWRRSWTSSA